MIETNRYEPVELDSEQALWDWLEENHHRAEGVWFITYKKSAGDRYLSTEQLLDAGLAYGWVDGIRRKLDDQRTMQLYSPRATSAWTQSYKKRAERLMREGRMQPAGFAKVSEGKASGLWDYWNDVDQLIQPADLKASLTRVGAQSAWEEAGKAYRRNLLRWIKLAKTAPTRDKRIETVVQAIQSGKKLPNM